jgi:NAD(P)H-dependent FMN reductase
MESIDVFGICGSVRAGSLNRALLLAAQELARAPFQVEAPNRFGGAFAQLQLADLLRRSGAEVLSDLDVAVGYAHRHVDDLGVLVGEDPRREITELWQGVLPRAQSGRQVVPA